MELGNKIMELEDEIEKLEEKELSWSNIEKLAMLYTVKHHMCKKMEMEDGENSIGFQGEFRSSGREGNSRGSEQQNREIREIARGMTREELEDVVNRHAREMQERGNNGSYQRLYNRMRRYRRK